MTTRKKMNYQVKEAYRGRVRLEDGESSTTLDEKTPQDVLAKLYETVLGKGFIEPVATPATQPKTTDAKAGQ